MKLSAWVECDTETEQVTFQLSSAGQPKGSTFLFEIEAATLEEAQAVYHMRMGWGAYDPGTPERCPVCADDHVVYYPEGSGQCWKCELAKTEKARPSADFAAGIEAAAKHVAAHSCVSSCCGAQPSGDVPAQLAFCIRRLTG